MIHWYKKTETVGNSAKMNAEKIAAILRLHSETRAQRFLKSHYVWDYNFILSQLKDLPNESFILDAGGGHGALQFLLARKHNVVNVDRDDYADEIWELNTICGVSIEFKQNELSAIEYEDELFNVVVSCSALEHNKFEEMPGIIKELERVMEPGGKLVMTLVGWCDDLGYREYAKNDWIEVYTEEKIRALFENTNFELGEESDTDTILLSIIQFQQIYSGYDCPWIPVGVVAEKRGKNA